MRMRMLLRLRRWLSTLVSTRLLGAATVGAAAGLAAMAVATRRVAVEGDSMRPTLLPGDRVVAVRCRRGRPGDLVVLVDPRDADRLLVKRVTAAGPEGHTVAGDNEAASTDSRTFGPVPHVWGRVVFRYHPPERGGQVR
ncbi:MAG: nickel-type superoxide dismutase maturation protease [Acidimicrobiales bacterium]